MLCGEVPIASMELMRGDSGGLVHHTAGFIRAWPEGLPGVGRMEPSVMRKAMTLKEFISTISLAQQPFSWDGIRHGRETILRQEMFYEPRKQSASYSSWSDLRTVCSTITSDADGC